MLKPFTADPSWPATRDDLRRLAWILGLVWLALAAFTTLAQRFLGWRLAIGLIGGAGALFTLGLLLVAAGSVVAASLEQRSSAVRSARRQEAAEAASSDDMPVFGRQPIGVRATVRPSAYALLAHGGRLAVVRTPQGLFLPGGGVEPGETPRDAVVREAREECGLAVQIGVWTVSAVDFVYSPTERTHFEKRSTFVDAQAHGPRVGAGEPDHGLEWLLPHEAIAQLSHASHRWAAAQWHGRRAPT